MLDMAEAGRLMARRKKARGHSPAASRACLVGRSLTRPRLYRRSLRAGCEACTRADKMTAESTARPLLTQCHPALMLSREELQDLEAKTCAKPGYPKGKRAAQVGVVGAPRGCAHTGFRAGYPKGRRPPVLYHWSRMVRFPAAAVTASTRM